MRDALFHTRSKWVTLGVTEGEKMFQDIAPYEYHVEWSDRKPVKADYVTAWNHGGMYMEKGEDFVTFEALSAKTGMSFEQLEESVYYLVAVSDRAFFVLDPKAEAYSALFQWFEKAEDMQMMSPRNMRGIKESWISFAAIVSWRLLDWYEGNQFCGRCGQEMERGTTERSMVCPSCGAVRYPQLCPAVIVAITDGDRVVGTQYLNHMAKHYALVAGYMEIGETYEDTIRREVMEEVGLKVKNITYYKSQPWPYSGSVLSGFYCQLDGSDEIHRDDTELSVALWLKREDIPESTGCMSLTETMLIAFKDKTYPMYEAWEGGKEQ